MPWRKTIFATRSSSNQHSEKRVEPVELPPEGSAGFDMNAAQNAGAPPGRLSTKGVFVSTLLVSTAVYGLLAYVLSLEPSTALSPAVARLLRAAPLAIACINASALTSLVLGWRAIRRGSVRTHRRYMLAASVLISAFLILYVTRVALGGVKAFPGPAPVRTYVYLPILTIHIVLSIVAVPLVVYNLLIGLTRPSSDVWRTPHAAVGRVGVALWSTSLALGIVVYVMLNILF